MSVPTRRPSRSNGRTSQFRSRSEPTRRRRSWPTPLRAATFAIENRVDLDEANRWLDQSIKANENIRNLFEKARAQAMAGDRAGAIATAQRAIAKAGPKDADEVGEIQHSIASWGGSATSK